MKSIGLTAVFACFLAGLAGCCHCQSACYSPCGSSGYGGGFGMGYGDCVSCDSGCGCGGGGQFTSGCGCNGNGMAMAPQGQPMTTYSQPYPAGGMPQQGMMMNEAQPNPVPAAQNNPVQMVPPGPIQESPTQPMGQAVQPGQLYPTNNYFPPQGAYAPVQPTSYSYGGVPGSWNR